MRVPNRSEASLARRGLSVRATGADAIARVNALQSDDTLACCSSLSSSRKAPLDARAFASPTRKCTWVGDRIGLEIQDPLLRFFLVQNWGDFPAGCLHWHATPITYN